MWLICREIQLYGVRPEPDWQLTVVPYEGCANLAGNMEQRAPNPLSNIPLVGLGVNAALATFKILAGVVGNSYALIADGIESTADIVTSLVVWGGLRVADAPADEHFPYGYGKAEALAGIVAAGSLLSAAGLIAWQSVREIQTPHHLPHWGTLVVLIAVVLVKESLARWVGRAGQESQSTSLQADAWHHRSDALTSLAAFVGISIGLVGGPGYEPADDWAALVACLVIAFSGVQLARLGLRDLLDAAPPESLVTQVRQTAGDVPGVLAVEKCRLRKSGTRFFVEIHVEVAGQATVQQGHDIARQVRLALCRAPLRIADAFVHVEPYGRPTEEPVES